MEVAPIVEVREIVVVFFMLATKKLTTQNIKAFRTCRFEKLHNSEMLSEHDTTTSQ